MPKDMTQRSLLDEDLGDLTIEDVECKSCRMLCSWKHPMMYWGRPLMICTMRDESMQALFARAARLRELDDGRHTTSHRTDEPSSARRLDW